jgi:hypothetical protein
MSAATHVVEEMDQATCRRLAATLAVGRIASTYRALPKIVPVHFTLHRDEVVIGALDAHNAVRIHDGDVVAFETDTYDPDTSEGWSVGVTGPCRVVADAAEIARLDALGFTPWTSAGGGRYLALPLDLVYGRALIRLDDEGGYSSRGRRRILEPSQVSGS